MTVLAALIDDMLASAAQEAARSDWNAVRTHVDDILILSPGHPEALALAALTDRHRPAVTQARRRQMTVMFCDLVGSTPLAERLDPEAVNDVLTGYQEICAASVERYGGTIYSYIGDGVLAYFSYPRAHEDDARRAVLAGLDLQAALAEHAQHVAERFGVTLAARVGVHTGLVALSSLQVRGRTEGGVISGSTPNTAARIESVAETGTVWLSDVTCALVEGYVEVEPLGPVELKGIGRPLELYRAIGRTGARSRLDVVGPRLSRFVGRQEERARLVRAWTDTVANWQHGADDGRPEPPRPIRIVGEPGVGKSRLALGVRRRVLSDGGTVIELPCEPFVSEPLGPFADGLRRACGIAPFDEPTVKLDKLDDEVGAAGVDDLLAVLSHLIGISDPARAPVPELSPLKLRAVTIDAVLRWLAARASLAPMLVLVEDLQWADESTAELLRTLIVNPPPGCMILATSRPGDRHDLASMSEEMALTILDAEESAELVRDAGLDDALTPDLLDALVARAGGIPLFIEQLARLARSDSDAATATEIPLSLRDLFQTQLDSLGDALFAAQVAATIGRDFDADTLLRVHERLEAAGEPAVTAVWLDDALVRLSDAGMIVRRRVGGDRLRFRHALLGDAAYESQLLAERTTRHHAIAEVLLESPIGVSQPGLIAFHFREAGEPFAAIEQHLRAAEKATAAGEFREVKEQLDRAEELLDHVDDPLPSELAIRMARGAARSASEGLAAVGLEAEFDRCREICRVLGQRNDDDLALTNVSAGLWGYYVTRGRLDAAEELTNENARLAGSSGEPIRHARVDSQRGTEAIFCGRWIEARECFERSVDRFGEVRDGDHRWVTPSDPLASNLAFLGPICAVTGDLALAEHRVRQSLERAADLVYPRGPYSVAFTRIYETWMHRMIGSYDRALEAAQEAASIGEKFGFMDWQLLGQLHVLAAEARLGVREDGQHRMTPVLDFWSQLGAGVGLPLFLVEQAELHVLADELDLAQACLDRTFTLALNGGPHADGPAPERYRQNQLLAEAHRVRARLLQAQVAPPDDVIRELESAIAVATEQGATLFALKAQLELLELLDVGRRPPELIDALRANVERYGPDASFLQLDRARRLVRA